MTFQTLSTLLLLLLSMFSLLFFWRPQRWFEYLSEHLIWLNLLISIALIYWELLAEHLLKLGLHLLHIFLVVVFVIRVQPLSCNNWVTLVFFLFGFYLWLLGRGFKRGFDLLSHVRFVRVQIGLILEGWVTQFPRSDIRWIVLSSWILLNRVSN